MEQCHFLFERNKNRCTLVNGDVNLKSLNFFFLREISKGACFSFGPSRLGLSESGDPQMKRHTVHGIQISPLI